MTHKILLTCAVVFVYCMIWSGLEQALYGENQGRIVDDIMMLLFIPIIWKAIENITI